MYVNALHKPLCKNSPYECQALFVRQKKKIFLNHRLESWLHADQVSIQLNISTMLCRFYGKNTWTLTNLEQNSIGDSWLIYDVIKLLCFQLSFSNPLYFIHKSHTLLFKRRPRHSLSFYSCLFFHE